MEFKIEILPYTLKYKRPATTSRGVYTDHKVWYIILRDRNNPERYGKGECAPLPDLSCDYSADYENVLMDICKKFEKTQIRDFEKLKNYPSIRFGFETALNQFFKGGYDFWDTPFSRGDEGIRINGLVWMADYDNMLKQVEEKISAGFHCIKLKIGAINFEDELRLIKHIRQRFSDNEIIIRVDANGNFSTGDVLEKLNRLAEFNIHSIEQPIKAGQYDELAELCKITPIPIALDEELIGINEVDEKQILLAKVKPQYIVLKPTLHGGLNGADEWITIAESLGIGWWATSALESQIGLNAIAQWCATKHNPLHQGLGTGLLYENNINDVPLEIRGEKLFYVR
jgi:o-succinylbenzoate synthase